MKRLLHAALVLAAAIGSAAPAQPAQVTAQDPEAVRALFTRWGYRPAPLELQDGPYFVATLDDGATTVGFGGCTNNRDCVNVVLLTSYSDILNPPFEWLNERNNDYGLVTLTRGDGGKLQLRMGILLGTQGISEALFIRHLEEWVATNRDLAQRALDAHLVQPQTAAAARSIAPLTARR
jgi:hypothetical protein